eukprot:g29990.t1
MKRILTVLTRREIHQQVLRSKEMLLQQTQREELETQRFQLEESMKGLRWKESSDPTRRSTARGTFRDSMATQAWKATLQKYEADHERLLRELVPLRRDTMQLLSPDWRFARKYSDLPGAINWKRQWVRALEDRRFHHLRSARFWVQVVKQVRAPARRVLTASLNSANVPLPPANPMLRMLNGRLSLYEALTALGPMWSLPAQNLKCVAQRRLNELCSSKSEECHFNSVTVLLRSGASLLSTDGRGRLPAHLASSAGTHMALQLLVRLLQLAPATLLIEDDEGATPLGLLARAPLLQKVIESEDAEQAIILTQFSSGGLLSQLSDAALTCAAALPQQTTRLLQQSPEAARAWRVLASAGGGRAALLLAPERMDESLEDLTWQAEEREGQAAARLRQAP